MLILQINEHTSQFWFGSQSSRLIGVVQREILVKTERVATATLRRSSIVILLDKPYCTSVLIDEILREQGSLLAGDYQLRVLGVEEENTQIIEQQVIVQVLAELVKIIHVVAADEVVERIQNTDVLLCAA